MDFNIPMQQNNLLTSTRTFLRIDMLLATNIPEDANFVNIYVEQSLIDDLRDKYNFTKTVYKMRKESIIYLRGGKIISSLAIDIDERRQQYGKYVMCCCFILMNSLYVTILYS